MLSPKYPSLNKPFGTNPYWEMIAFCVLLRAPYAKIKIFTTTNVVVTGGSELSLSIILENQVAIIK
jgi:hypothetical protein